MRWIWIDRFLAFEKAKSARAVKYLSLAEDIFAAHFPGYPVMPAPLMLEGLAQTGGILVGDAYDFKYNVVLAKISKAVFTDDALAGQELQYEATVASLRDEGSVIDGRILADGKPIASAEVQFAHLDPERTRQMFGETEFVFKGELQRMLRSAHAATAPTG